MAPTGPVVPMSRIILHELSGVDACYDPGVNDFVRGTPSTYQFPLKVPAVWFGPSSPPAGGPISMSAFEDPSRLGPADRNVLAAALRINGEDQEAVLRAGGSTIFQPHTITYTLLPDDRARAAAWESDGRIKVEADGSISRSVPLAQ